MTSRRRHAAVGPARGSRNATRLVARQRPDDDRPRAAADLYDKVMHGDEPLEPGSSIFGPIPGRRK